MSPITLDKLRHFYFNKYVVSLFARKRYYLSYSFKYEALWFRNYKVGTRTIDKHLKMNSEPTEYIYSSNVGYNPKQYEGYFKFAFVRNPVDRFISGWKDKVINQNYFGFDQETHNSMKDLKNFIKWVGQMDLENCDEHLRAQYSLIDLNNIDFIGRFENFEQDLRIVADKIGMPYDENLHLNSSGKKPLEISLDNRKAIQKLYRKDYRIFYPKDMIR
ncbi:MAG: sulfotransferase family protein [Bacteroidota bacterium]|nr:sulfotransferase family protein [Bacteroidota bacterium]MDX5426532.1 sulfotransferase family protein [Bacteroidota bacterium]MDX5449197.1 sulfotransferase family protein [Bacteroidota bacterium]